MLDVAFWFTVDGSWSLVAILVAGGLRVRELCHLQRRRGSWVAVVVVVVVVIVVVVVVAVIIIVVIIIISTSQWPRPYSRPSPLPTSLSKLKRIA